MRKVAWGQQQAAGSWGAAAAAAAAAPHPINASRSASTHTLVTHSLIKYTPNAGT